MHLEVRPYSLVFSLELGLNSVYSSDSGETTFHYACVEDNPGIRISTRGYCAYGSRRAVRTWSQERAVCLQRCPSKLKMECIVFISDTYL